MAKSVFDQIKNQNGETFAKAIRNYHNGIFEIPGIVSMVRYAGRNAEPIMNYLLSLMKVEIEEQGAYEDPIKLLDKAGYDAYYADTLGKQNAISKYYATIDDLKRMGAKLPYLSSRGEGLCTFGDPSRFKEYYIINAVRKDVDKIKREDFVGKEERDDEYGTSVLSIQMLKKGGFISIKNRYNHTVKNPDSTLNSNPDNIIKGLSQSLKNYFNVDFSAQKTLLPDGYIIINDQIIRYNSEENNVYFGSDFYVKDGMVHPLNKSEEIMLDAAILNVRKKTLFDPSWWMSEDAFFSLEKESSVGCESITGVLAYEFKGKKISVTKNKEGGHNVCADDVPVMTVVEGQIVALNLPTIKKIGDNFSLSYLRALKKFSAPNLEEIGDEFLTSNKSLEKIDLPNVRKIGNDFLCNNFILQECFVPRVEEIGNYFLSANKSLERLDLSNVRKIGKEFLFCDKVLKELNVPKLEEIEKDFLRCNSSLEKLDLPNVKKIDDDFLRENEILSEVFMPKVEEIHNNVLKCNNALRKLDVPNLNIIGDNFLYENEILTEFNAPALEQICDNVLYSNKSLTKINLPNVETIGIGRARIGSRYNNDPSCFLAENEVLTEFYAPCLSEKSINKLPEQIRRVLHPSTEEKAGLKKMSEGWKKVEKNEGKASEGMNPEMAKKFYDKIKPQND